MSAFQVGERVRMVRHGGLADYQLRAGQEATVVRLASSNDPCMRVRYDDGGEQEAYPKRFDRVTPATTPRLFKQGDKVRVVRLKPVSHLAITLKAKVGDVLTVELDQTRLGADVIVGGFGCFADQFVLAEEEWVKTPEGVVAHVEEVTAGGAKKVGGMYYDPSRLTPATAPKPLPEVPEDADTMLRMVDRFLSRGTTESQRLADVLTALRGPDESGQNKAATTCPVRVAALPETAKKGLVGGAVGMSFDAAPLAVLTGRSHFANHIQRAVNALRAMGREVK